MKFKKYRLVKTTSLVVLVCCICSCSKNTPTEPKLTLSEKLQEALDTEFAKFNGKGVSAAVLIPGEDIWLGTSGISHDTTPISSDMIFNIGSVTKMFIGPLVLKLVEEGLLTLEDTIDDWLPDYPNVEGTVTIRQLLNHTSGIYNFTENPEYENMIFADFTRIWTPEETITLLVTEPRYFPPGTTYRYANTNYVLLGMIIEEITGTQVSALLRDRFLDPLGLSNTFFPVEEEIIGEQPHQWDDIDQDGTLDDLSGYSGNALYSLDWTAGAIFSTAEDLVKWSYALLHEKRVLNQSTLDQMLDLYPVGDDLGYGYGISIPTDFIDGVQALGHDGHTPGWGARLLYMPESGVSISIIVNDGDYDSRAAISRVLAQNLL